MMKSVSPQIPSPIGNKG